MILKGPFGRKEQKYIPGNRAWEKRIPMFGRKEQNNMPRNN